MARLDGYVFAQEVDAAEAVEQRATAGHCCVVPALKTHAAQVGGDGSERMIGWEFT